VSIISSLSCTTAHIKLDTIFFVKIWYSLQYNKRAQINLMSGIWLHSYYDHHRYLMFVLQQYNITSRLFEIMFTICISSHSCTTLSHFPSVNESFRHSSCAFFRDLINTCQTMTFQWPNFVLIFYSNIRESQVKNVLP
jgi:hypothetical protein